MMRARHADPDNVPDSPDEWLEQFNTFSIYEVLPKLIELRGLNVETQIESKKTSPDDNSFVSPSMYTAWHILK